MKKKPERKPWNPWTGGDLFYLEEPAIGPERSGGIDLEGAAEEAVRVVEEARRTGEFPGSRQASVDADRAERLRRDALTGVDRLAYYRSHGLGRCDDYPGGDAQFEADVLSGEQRIEDVTLEPLGREDAYIIDRMKDGRFCYDWAFGDFRMRPEVDLAYMMNAGKNGFTAQVSYSFTTPVQYMKDVLSGKYARDVLARRENVGS